MSKRVCRNRAVTVMSRSYTCVIRNLNVSKILDLTFIKYILNTLLHILKVKIKD